MEPVSYGDVLAANIRAARSRARLPQELVAARMRALGFREWRYQTTGAVERGKRRVTAEEIAALAWVLQTSVKALMVPADDELVEFPAGGVIAAAAVRRSTEGHNDGSVSWDGEKPIFDPEPMVSQLTAEGIFSRARVSTGTGKVSHQDPGTGQWVEDGEPRAT
jgi:hypothetical protein